MKNAFPDSPHIDDKHFDALPPDGRGEAMALNLFHTMAQRVPAYKDFLHKAGVQHARIQTYDDFTQYVPVMDKKNYLSQYPLSELCLEGDMFKNRIISVSSGSS